MASQSAATIQTLSQIANNFDRIKFGNEPFLQNPDPAYATYFQISLNFVKALENKFLGIIRYPLWVLVFLGSLLVLSQTLSIISQAIKTWRNVPTHWIKSARKAFLILTTVYCVAMIIICSVLLDRMLSKFIQGEGICTKEAKGEWFPSVDYKNDVSTIRRYYCGLPDARKHNIRRFAFSRFIETLKPLSRNVQACMSFIIVGVIITICAIFDTHTFTRYPKAQLVLLVMTILTGFLSTSWVYIFRYYNNPELRHILFTMLAHQAILSVIFYILIELTGIRDYESVLVEDKQAIQNADCKLGFLGNYAFLSNSNQNTFTGIFSLVISYVCGIAIVSFIAYLLVVTFGSIFVERRFRDAYRDSLANHLPDKWKMVIELVVFLLIVVWGSTLITSLRNYLLSNENPIFIKDVIINITYIIIVYCISQHRGSYEYKFPFLFRWFHGIFLSFRDL